MTASPSDVERWEFALTQARDQAKLATGPSEESLSIADAYVISRRMLEARERQGWRRAGRKIGFTNSEMMRDYAIDKPIFGYMYDRTVTQFEGDHYAASITGLVQPKIEPEIVFHLRRPLHTTDPVEALCCVDWIALGFELVHCHLPGWRFSAAETIADGGLHGRLVVGTPTYLDPARGQLVDALAMFRVSLFVDGEEAARGGGAAVLGSPLMALMHLVEVLHDYPDHPPLAADELVTTGTLTTAMPVTVGQRWSVTTEGLSITPFALTIV